MPRHRLIPSAIIIGLLLAQGGIAAAGTLSWNLESTDGGQIPAPNAGDEQTACLTGDFDGDGRDDIVIAERTAPDCLTLFFRRDTGWEREVVDSGVLPIEAGGVVADIDADGDLDILIGGDNSSNEIWWWENPGPPPYADDWTRRLIKDDGATKSHDQAIADFDGDGLRELVFWNQNDSDRLFVADFPADPRASGPWPYVEIWDAPGRSEGMTAADINLDGKLDVVAAGYWFEHTGGVNYTAHVIEDDRLFTRPGVGQFVPGGRPEVVLSPGDDIGPLRWSEYDGTSWTATELDPEMKHGHSMSVGDVDQDGQLDFFTAEMHSPGAGDLAVARVFLNQGGGVFAADTVSVGIGLHEARLADVNGDGWLDVVGKPYTHQAPGLYVWLQDAGPSAAPASRPAVTMGIAPTPFNARCVVRLTAAAPRRSDVTVHDLRGRHVATLGQRVEIGPASRSLTWDGRGHAGEALPSGVYLVRAAGDGWQVTARAVLVE